MRNFFKDESGASLVEYGLLVGLIAVAALTAVETLGNNVASMFGEVATKLEGVTNSIAD